MISSSQDTPDGYEFDLAIYEKLVIAYGQRESATILYPQPGSSSAFQQARRYLRVQCAAGNLWNEYFADQCQGLSQVKGTARLKVLRQVLAVKKPATHHKDSFDRMLIRQAIVNGYTLISADSTVQNYVSEGLRIYH